MKQHLERTVGVTTQPSGTWVQTERAGHEKWAKLIRSHPRAAELMHVIVGNMGRHNALVASIPNLQRMMGCSRNTVIRAVTALKDQNWIEVRRLHRQRSRSLVRQPRRNPLQPVFRRRAGVR
jgi:DNA-binding transcriptional MocR family regulator